MPPAYVKPVVKQQKTRLFVISKSMADTMPSPNFSWISALYDHKTCVGSNRAFWGRISSMLYSQRLRSFSVAFSGVQVRFGEMLHGRCRTAGGPQS